MGTVRLDNLSKHFGKVKAVDEVSLEMKDKAFITLLGPSGCGKSTTLNLIAGLEDATRGKVLLDERDITDLPPNLRNMAMVFQNYALYPHMNVFDNLAFALKLAKRPEDERKRRVQRVAEMLGIEELLDRRPSQLSGGQQQRVALGRAIIREPQVFLLDEPMSNLDARLRIQTRAELKRLQRQLETTTIFVTHDQEEAMIMSDYVAVMRSGKVVQYDTPHEIYNNPVHIGVANFIGNPPMNFMEGKLYVGDNRTSFETAGTTLQFPVEIGRKLKRVAEKATLGIRPEDITTGPAGDADGNPGTISLLEPIGSDTYVEVALGQKMIIMRSHPDRPYQIGENVSVKFDPNKMYFFDQETGARL